MNAGSIDTGRAKFKFYYFRLGIMLKFVANLKSNVS